MAESGTIRSIAVGEGWDDDDVAAINDIKDSFWRAAIATNRKFGAKPSDIKAARLMDSAQYALVAALLATITIPMMLANNSDFAPGTSGTWPVHVYRYSSMISTCLWIVTIFLAILDIIFINVVPPEALCRYLAMPGFNIAIAPAITAWLGVVALAPALAGGAYVMDGSTAFGVVTAACMGSVAVYVLAVNLLHGANVTRFTVKYSNEGYGSFWDGGQAAAGQSFLGSSKQPPRKAQVSVAPVL